MTAIVFAFDRKTARSFDADGRMRVKDCILSTAEVNPYRGAEIPGYKELGLDPDKIYNLYRDADELRKSVKSFEGVPLLVKHIPQSADDPQREFIGGSVHSIGFDGTHLRGDLLVMAGDAIDMIESDELSDLSCGYRYKPDMTSGEVDGVKYDGVMRAVDGNHVALVEDGRASGAHVADSALRDLRTSDNQQEPQAMDPNEQNAPPAGAPAAAPAAAPAPTGDPEVGAALKQIAAMLQSINERLGGGAPAPAAAPAAPAPAALDSEGGAPSGEVPPTNQGESESSLNLSPAVGANDEENGEVAVPPANQEGTPARGNPTPHGAMDAKGVKTVVQAAVLAERARAKGVSDAKQDVRGVLGDVIALDDAGDIYREALTVAGVDVKQITKGTEKVAWQSYRAAVGAVAGARPRAEAMAMDGKSDKPAYMAHVEKITVRG